MVHTSRLGEQRSYCAYLNLVPLRCKLAIKDVHVPREWFISCLAIVKVRKVVCFRDELQVCTKPLPERNYINRESTVIMPSLAPLNRWNRKSAPYSELRSRGHHTNMTCIHNVTIFYTIFERWVPVVYMDHYGMLFDASNPFAPYNIRHIH